MRLHVASLLLIAIAFAAQVRTQDEGQGIPEIQLRGGRFKPLTSDRLNAEQRTLVDNVMKGPRGSVAGPFNILLRSPDLGERIQRVGEYVRFRTSIPPRLNELAILITARAWTGQFEWYDHYTRAIQAGLTPESANAVAHDKRPARMRSDEAIVYDFTSELLDRRQVSDANFKAAVDTFGEQGVVDLMGTIGYYHIMSILLNVDGYPLPPGVPVPLEPLKR